MIRDKSQSEKLEIIKRSLLEDSKNREKYLKIRSNKGLINEKNAKERYLFSERSIISNKEGETMNEKPNTVAITEEIAVENKPKLKEKKVVLSDVEKERLAKEKEKAKEKERLAKEKEKAKEKERLAKEKEKAKEKERLAKEKEKAKEKERLAKEKEKAKEKERLAKEKEKAKEKERLAKEKEEQEKIEVKELAKEKEKQERIEAKEKAKEQERLAKEKEEQERIEALKKAKEQERLAKEKEEQERIEAKKKAKEQERLAKEKEEQERIEAEEKAKEQERLAKEKEEQERIEAERLANEKEEEKVEKEKQKKLDIQERMRRKNEAQKLLDQGFMKSEAEKTQTKEMDLKEKLSKLEVDYEESYDDKLDKELEEAYEKIDFLVQENEKMKANIAENDKNVNKLSNQLAAVTQEKKNEQKTNQDLEKKLSVIKQEKEDLIVKLNDANKKNVGLYEELNKQKDELGKSSLVIEELHQELAKKEQEIAIVEKNDNQFAQKEAELIKQKNLYEETAKKVVELETINQELIKNIEQLKEDSDCRFAQKEVELATQQNSYEEAINKIAELEVEKQETEKRLQLLTEQKTKLQESLNDTKQKKATLLSIKYNDIFVLDKSGEDISSELKTYLESLKKDNEDSINELNDVKVKLLAKDELIVALEKENSDLKIIDQKPTLFDEEVEVEDKYDVEAEIKKIKDEISQIKKREISTLENNDQQYAMNKNQDIYQRIHNLEQEIYQKDQQLQLIRQQFNDINEEKIIDPEFKRKIRRARDMKKELNESFEEEKKFINRSIIQVEQQINQKKIEVTNAKEKVETIEKEYAGQTDRTSLGRESYLSKRGKALIELELFEDRLQKLNDELVDLKGRYDYLIQCYDERIEQLNQSEKEIIDYYLSEMKSDLIGKDKIYSVKNEEKEDLIRQLNELNQAQQQTQTALLQNNQVISKALETNREIKEQILSDKRQNIDQSIRRLENEIQEKNIMCNNLISLLNTVNLKFGERVSAEKQIRATDVVANYLKIANDTEDLTQEYHDNLNQTQEVTEKIDALVSNPDEKSEVLRLRAKLEDLDILKSDLIAKIGFSRKKMENLVNDEKVLYYTKLSESIKELKDKQEELKLNIEKLKAEISEKNADLVRIKEEKFKLE